jgi:DNA-binding MarR family transcriptional regulator
MRQIKQVSLNPRDYNNLGREFSDTMIFMHQAIAKQAGLSHTDHKYLGLLVQKGQLTAGELATLTGFTTGAVTGLIDRLEKKKLVKRQYDKNDRRRVIIVPNTEKALKKFGGIFQEITKRRAKMMKQFTKHEVEVIERFLAANIQFSNEIIQLINSKK